MIIPIYSSVINYLNFDDAIKQNVFDKNSLLIYPLIHDSLDELEKIISFKTSYSFTKFLVIDFNESKDNFIKLSKYGIDGFLLGRFNKKDLLYSIDRLISGSKFFDREILYSIVDANSLNVSSLSNSESLLTNRESEILLKIAHGLSNIEIASDLKISENTVKKHISNIFLKINVHDRTQATIYAYDMGLLLG